MATAHDECSESAQVMAEINEALDLANDESECSLVPFGLGLGWLILRMATLPEKNTFLKIIISLLLLVDSTLYIAASVG